MEQLKNIMADIKLRVKPVLLQSHINERKKLLLTAAICGICSSFSLSIISFIDRESVMNAFLATVGILALPVFVVSLGFSLIFHMEYKKLLKKEWTGTVKDEVSEIKDEQQQLTVEELKHIFNVDLPPKLLFFIDDAISKKGFITHDDFHEMLQYKEKDNIVEDHYRQFMENMIDPNIQQEENLKKLLGIYESKNNHKKSFNSRKVL